LVPYYLVSLRLNAQDDIHKGAWCREALPGMAIARNIGLSASTNVRPYLFIG
jgi:hypothetical protein